MGFLWVVLCVLRVFSLCTLKIKFQLWVSHALTLISPEVVSDCIASSHNLLFLGVFSVDALLNKSQQRSEHGLWQWRDDRGVWHSYSWIDSKIIEAAYHSGEDELSLATMGRTYTIDLNAMQQVGGRTNSHNLTLELQ